MWQMPTVFQGSGPCPPTWHMPLSHLRDRQPEAQQVSLRSSPGAPLGERELVSSREHLCAWPLTSLEALSGFAVGGQES